MAVVSAPAPSLPPALAGAGLPAMDVAGRLGRLRPAMDRAGCDVLVVSHLPNVRYLTGFRGSAGVLVVRADDAVLVTDGRYGLQAPAEVAASGAPATVEVSPHAAQADLLARLASGAGRLGLEAEHVSWERQRQWALARGPRSAPVPTTGLVEGLRRTKDAGEVARVAAAAAVADAALATVAPMADLAPREAELALALDGEMRRLGAEAPAFATIVASGPNGAEPHHSPSGRRLCPGDLVIVDFGAQVDGYRSDMTRVLVVGDAGQVAAALRRAATVVLAAQDAGLAAVRHGVAAAEVDRACREVVGAAGLGDLFVHGTGHGVGLDVHEAPALAEPSADILCAGQVVTVEPGVYIPGLGGARTEDTVVVTDAGCQVLTMTPKHAQASLQGGGAPA
jgi:Xaa-Pro aminopeptidase